MGQTEIVVHMLYRQLLPQARLTLAQRAGTPSEGVSQALIVCEIALVCGNVSPMASTPVKHPRRLVGFACVYGAPMASEIVHIFGILGTRAVIQTGNCGALADGLVAGDLFVPTEAFCGEGAAQYYQPDCQRVTASAELLSSETFTR
jgi:hypothetical protein